MTKLTSWAGIVFVFLICAIASAQELTHIATIGSPLPEKNRPEAWASHVDFLCWISSTHIVYAGESGFVKCHDVAANRQVWSVRLGAALLAVCGDSESDHVFALDESGTIHVLSHTEGTETSRINREALVQLTRCEYLRPNGIAWVPHKKQLLVFTDASKYGENGFFLRASNLELAGKMKCDGTLHIVTIKDRGQFIVTVSLDNTIRVWDTQNQNEKLCVRKQEDKYEREFISNAVFDGKQRLIYTVDKNWHAGFTVIFDVSTNSETIFDSQNGHVVMDVDISRGRAALTGSSCTLTVVTFGGEVVAERKDVSIQRNAVIRFSPDGKQVAFGSWDRAVRVFELR